MRRMYLLVVVALLMAVASFTAFAGSTLGADGSASIWTSVSGEGLTPPANVDSGAYLLYEADLAALASVLSTAPQEGSGDAGASLALPMPDGSFLDVNVTEYRMMAPDLAATYPDMHTYWAVGAEDSSIRARLDLTPAGFHAMVWSDAGTALVNPLQPGNASTYAVYWKHDATPAAPFEELDVLGGEHVELPEFTGGLEAFTTGEELRTYRLALAATGEYTQYHGGTVPAAMAAIVTVMNRVNGIYETDFAIRMELVPNNDLVIYTDPNTDPYTNNNGFVMLGQNQANLDAVIGNANYDIGHVFSTGGGGVAFLQSVCNNANKARGVTGLPNPIGDPFAVDYVAHEMGHQYGGNHTFNGTTSACGGGNRNGATAMEPGSGSTIMAYAGICGAENLQLNSDPYFHAISLQEIINYSYNGNGNSCAAITPTGNSSPTADAGPSYTIPAETPFQLVGVQADPDGDDVLTSNWEQFDIGAAAPPNTDDGTRPIFRSFNPTESPIRVLPRLDDVLNNTLTFGEAWPTTDRELTFRFVVRDNNPGAGGVAWDTVIHNVENDAGPFEVTSQNSATSWNAGDTETVTWDVANTTAAPVSCSAVDIEFAGDGGYTFDVVLANDTPNDGSESITVPNVPTTMGRVKVICSDSIFFDINNSDIEITGGATAVQTASFESGSGSSLPAALVALVGLVAVAGLALRARRRNA